MWSPIFVTVSVRDGTGHGPANVKMNWCIYAGHALSPPWLHGGLSVECCGSGGAPLIYLWLAEIICYRGHNKWINSSAHRKGGSGGRGGGG